MFHDVFFFCRCLTSPCNLELDRAVTSMQFSLIFVKSQQNYGCLEYDNGMYAAKKQQFRAEVVASNIHLDWLAFPAKGLVS